MLLAEELLLIGLDPAKGSVVNSVRPQLLVGLAGALVGELALAGLVELSGERFVAVGGPPVDPLLAAAHQALARPEGRRAADQLRRLDKAIGGVWSRLVERLVDQGVLDRRRDRVVLFPVTRHPVLHSAVREELLEQVRAAAAGDGELEPRTAVVLALAGPSRLLEVVAPDRAGRRHAKRRIDTATELTPVAPVVKKVIAQMQAAAAVAVAAGGAASSS
ncbi:MAG TPA: GPP34 family phosphoprotein [Frankiaceae bacterium]|nr:GPP34 family phosphoprotein [Frankiaceae bacterium]